MEVENGNNVWVHYRGTLNDGSIFDDSRLRGEPLTFEIGAGQMIPGFDAAVLGMSVGDTKTIKLSPEEAYGYRAEEAIRPVPRTAFDDDFQFEIGGLIQGNGPRGPFVAKIEEVLEESIILDFNHPLAGKELSFDIELMSIGKPPTHVPFVKDDDRTAEPEPQLVTWRKSMKKAELLDVAKANGLNVNTRSTKAEIIEALETI